MSFRDGAREDGGRSVTTDGAYQRFWTLLSAHRRRELLSAEDWTRLSQLSGWGSLTGADDACIT